MADNANPNPIPVNQPAQQMDNNSNNPNIVVSAPNNNNNNNINNNNNNNRNRIYQNPVANSRDRMFHAIYFKAALTYSQVFPKHVRRFVEFIVLLKALLFFFILVYIHVTFLKTPATCLQHVKDNWPRDGVLRVEIFERTEKPPTISVDRADIKRQYEVFHSAYHKNFDGIGPRKKEFYLTKKEPKKNLAFNETYYDDLFTTFSQIKEEEFKETKADFEIYGDNICVVEYSLEYGHLRLSPTARQRLKIPVRRVQLDPATDKCFGDTLSKYLLREFVGYDDILMASVRVIAEQEENKGYLRNVVTGEHYRFVSMWWAAWSSYPTAFFVMILFSVSISMLLRYSHNQIFVFIVDLFQMLEFNMSARFPFAPLLTIILALVGMEAIMSEFFNDTSTAFYVILIVWIADQYDAICCHTSITKRHWLRFFYLYHYLFYAYHYRFNGQYSSLALVTSWLFIQHSMFYFFHHYELPVIVQQAQLMVIARNQNAAQYPNGRTTGLNDGTGNGVNRDNRQFPQIRRIHINNNAFGGFVRPIMERRGNILNSLRRVLYNFGWTAPVPVRVQIGNLQRINLDSIQINPGNFAVITPTGATTITSSATPMTTNQNSNGNTSTGNTNIAAGNNSSVNNINSNTTNTNLSPTTTENTGNNTTRNINILNQQTSQTPTISPVQVAAATSSNGNTTTGMKSTTISITSPLIATTKTDEKLDGMGTTITDADIKIENSDVVVKQENKNETDGSKLEFNLPSIDSKNAEIKISCSEITSPNRHTAIPEEATSSMENNDIVYNIAVLSKPKQTSNENDLVKQDVNHKSSNVQSGSADCAAIDLASYQSTLQSSSTNNSNNCDNKHHIKSDFECLTTTESKSPSSSTAYKEQQQQLPNANSTSQKIDVKSSIKFDKGSFVDTIEVVDIPLPKAKHQTSECRHNPNSNPNRNNNANANVGDTIANNNTVIGNYDCEIVEKHDGKCNSNINVGESQTDANEKCREVSNLNSNDLNLIKNSIHNMDGKENSGNSSRNESNISSSSRSHLYSGNDKDKNDVPPSDIIANATT